jgi:hypothetical protein
VERQPVMTFCDEPSDLLQTWVIGSHSMQSS